MKAKLCFFDDYYVAARPKTERRIFNPQKRGEFHDSDALLQLYTSFFYDPYVKKFRLYYEAPIPETGTEIRMLKLAEADCVEDFISGKAEISVISGVDDVHGIHGAAITYNPDADPSHRYIFIGNAHADDKKLRNFVRAFSSDGKTFYDVAPIFPDEPDYKDTYNSVCYNPYKKEYVVTTRIATMDRRVAVIYSKDGIQWSRPQILMHPLSKGNMGEQHYALGVSHLDGLFYGILWRFITDLDQPDFTDMGGVMENDLLYSYDGDCFIPTDASPVCHRPPEPEYGCKQLWLLNMERENDKYVLVGGASRIAHGASYGKYDKFASTVLYDIRKEGFCALEGKGADSIVYLKPIYFEGGDIVINADASKGKLSLAIIEANGKAIDGFGFDDCVSMENEDCVEHKITFKNADTNALKGKRVRFALKLDNALLYSIGFEGRPFLHNRPQYSFNYPKPMDI